MVTLFIVEDEKLSRDALIHHIPWAEHRISLCGSAADGEQALPLLLQVRPDIILTDIRMPFMDGLALAEWSKKQLPQSRILFLTGHDEFSYAQKAIRLGVADFLLKPFTADQVLKAVGKCADKIFWEREQQRISQENRQEAANERRRMLTDALISGRCPDVMDMHERAEKIALNLHHRFYTVVLWPKLSTESEAAFSALRMKTESCLSFIDAHFYGCIILYDQKNERDEFLQELRQSLLHSELLLGKEVERLGEIHLSYEYARLQAAIKGELEKHETTNWGQSDLPDLLLLAQLREDDIQKYWHAYYLRYRSRLQSMIYRTVIYTQLYTEFQKQMRSLGYPWQEDARFEKQLLAGAAQESFVAFLSECTQTLQKAILGDSAPGAAQQALYLAENYMKENFSKAHLSLAEVAAAAHMHPNYFSTYFKEKTGRNFSDYLTALRMDRAKQWLRTSDASIQQISESIGYWNANYFSTVFRKEVGVSPRQYRAEQARGGV